MADLLDFLAVDVGPSARSARMTVVDALCVPRGSFFGGAGIAASVALMERATERPAVWATVQFLSSPTRGDVLDLTTDVIAQGARMSQLRVEASRHGERVFSAIGATGVARGDQTVAFETMPRVRPPDDCPPAVFEVPGDFDRSYFAAIDRRVAAERADLQGTSTHAAYWVCAPGVPVSAALLGYFADIAAFGVVRALGRPDGRATSLDNTLRVGRVVDTDWTLLDVRTHLVTDGYGHATVYLWSHDGVLMGSMSQTVALRASEP